MSTQKKSLVSSLKTAKKAKVAGGGGEKNASLKTPEGSKQVNLRRR